jgi:hypothetical protein
MAAIQRALDEISHQAPDDGFVGAVGQVGVSKKVHRLRASPKPRVMDHRVLLAMTGRRGHDGSAPRAAPRPRQFER